MIIIDKTVGSAEFIVDETAGTVTFEIKASVLGIPEDVKVPLDFKSVLTALEGGMSNTYVKWVLGLLLNLL